MQSVSTALSTLVPCENKIVSNAVRNYNCDSTTIRLRSDYDVSRAPASIQRDSTRAKNEHVNFSS